MANIKEVARVAGVSVATVSRVLNKNLNVKPKLRQKVLDAIQELNYQPSGIARNMRNQSARVIGLIITDIQNPFFTSLVRSVEDVAHQNHYTILLCNSDEDTEKEQLYFEVLSQERVAGVILVPSTSLSNKKIFKYKFPIVLVDRFVKDLDADSVTIDNELGAYEAVSHLIKLGHSRIGIVYAPTNVSTALGRYTGYKQALQENNIAFEDELTQMGDFKEQGGYIAANKLLDLSIPPTAIFSTNNLMTLGVLKAIHERGLKIPEDISIVGFDDMPWLSFFTPPLTAVRQPIYEIGKIAAELLLERLKGKATGQYQKIVLKPELIVRGSSAQITT